MPQLVDRFLFQVTGQGEPLRVARFTGREAMSELFCFEITVASADSGVSAADIVGKTALLRMTVDDADARLVHGIVSRFVVGDAGKKLTTYQVTLVPKAWRLLHRSNCRIFQNLRADEIIHQVLKGAGLAQVDDYAISVNRSPAIRDYCVQYRESDWAFVCRLMEEEGMYFFFEHYEDKHVLVIGDKSARLNPIDGSMTLVFRPPLGALSDEEHVSRIHYSEEVRTGKVTVRDYDFKRPDLLIEASKEAENNPDLEVYDHPGNPGNYLDPATGNEPAELRLEERTAWIKRAAGDSNCRRMAPGFLFTLAEHAREALNREWLLTRVEHRGAEPLFAESGAESLVPYENGFELIPSDVPFRPPLVTPKPTIRGVQSAIVVGPSGEEIHTDEHGRVKVRFHWDRLAKKNDRDSCWIRVSQVWAGKAWGAMHIPRIGQEVLVDFMDGDPDRPIIVGRVYHGTNVAPYALPEHKTRSTIKSDSTPGGGGSNELRFEDKAGSEEVYLHAQKDWTIAVEHDKNQTIGHDETLSVGNNRTAKVEVDQSETIGNNETFSVGKDRTKSVGGNETESIGKERSISVGADHIETIAGNMTLSVGKAKNEEVTENSTETVGKAKTLSVGTSLGLDVKGDMSTTVASNQTEKVDLEKKIEVGNKLTIIVGDAKVTVEKNGNVTIDGATLSVKTSGDVKVESSGKVDLKASGDVKMEASGKVEIKSSGAMDVNASGAVKVKGTNVGIN